jgi:hypothetical protein
VPRRVPQQPRIDFGPQCSAHGEAELAGQIAKDSRPRNQTVAGYDLTFSPVKSVSTLWAVADPATTAVIERAHQAAVQDALSFIEEHALFTRTCGSCEQDPGNFFESVLSGGDAYVLKFIVHDWDDAAATKS